MKSFPFTRSRPRVACATKRFFHAISYRVARFRSHRSSLHSDRCSRMWTIRCRVHRDSLALNPVDSDLNSPLITHNVFSHRDLSPGSRKRSSFASLWLYTCLLLLNLSLSLGLASRTLRTGVQITSCQHESTSFCSVKADLNVRNASPDVAHVLGTF